MKDKLREARDLFRRMQAKSDKQQDLVRQTEQTVKAADRALQIERKGQGKCPQEFEEY